MQPFVVTLCGLLIYRGIARWYMDDATIGFGYGDDFDTLTGSPPARPSASRTPSSSCVVVALDHGRGAAPLGLRPLPVRGRQERGGGALLRHQHRPGHRHRLHHQRRAGRPLRRLLRLLHQLDLALGPRQLLRALRHRRRRAGRLLAARRRGLDPRHRAGHGAAAGAAEPGQPPGHPELAELRRDGRGDPAGRAGRPAAAAPPAGRASPPAAASPRREPAIAQA